MQRARDGRTNRVVPILQILQQLSKNDFEIGGVSRSGQITVSDYRRTGPTETMRVVLSASDFGSQPGQQKLRSATHTFRETWSVAPNGTRRMIETVYLGGGKSEMDWQPPSAMKGQHSQDSRAKDVELQQSKESSETKTTPERVKRSMVVRVRSSDGTSITLDDVRNTRFTIGADLRYFNAQGHEAANFDLRPGDEVVLFIDPDTRRVYRVSADLNDLAAASGGD